MKKLYKFVTIILVSIILVTALLSNIVYADEKLTSEQLKDPLLSQTQTDHSQIQTPGDVDKYGQTGEAEGSSDVERPVNKVTSGGQTVTNLEQISQKHDRDSNLQSDQTNFFLVEIASLIKAFFRSFQIFMSEAVHFQPSSNNDGRAIVTKTEAPVLKDSDMFTIQNLLMGKYELFDINIFDKNVETEAASDMSKKIKDNVTIWYFIIRNIAIMASLVVLVYIGIRMAMSTTASDSAKYKKMFLSWGVSFFLIFVLHYICLILIYFSDSIVKVLASLVPKGTNQFEYDVMYRLFISKVEGPSVFLQAILYCMLIWYQVKFFFIYLKRVVSNAFLILIAPLVTITYAIDKANDCKAQAFNAWLEELITNIFIQPLHLLLFLVLMYSAGAIAVEYPIIAILFMFGLSKAEGILRSLFKLKGSTISGIDDGTKFTSIVKLI